MKSLGLAENDAERVFPADVTRRSFLTLGNAVETRVSTEKYK